MSKRFRKGMRTSAAILLSVIMAVSTMAPAGAVLAKEPSTEKASPEEKTETTLPDEDQTEVEAPAEGEDSGGIGTEGTEETEDSQEETPQEEETGQEPPAQNGILGELQKNDVPVLTEASAVEVSRAPFRLTVAADGRYQIWVTGQDGTAKKQYYDTVGNNGSVVHFIYGGHTYIVATAYLQGTASTDLITPGKFTCENNVVSGYTITTTYQANVALYGSTSGETIRVNLTQKLTAYDTYIKKDFDVTFDRQVSDMRFIHGGDTYFGGKDAGYPAFNPLNNSVYIVPVQESGTDKDYNVGMMQFSGDTETPADRYFAGRYADGNAQAKAGWLQNYSTPITSTTQVDGGYHLQWNKTGPGNAMSIRSTERFISEGGAVQILAPGPVNVAPGSDFAVQFTALNLSSTETVTATLSIVCPGTGVKIYDGNQVVTQITLAPNQTKNLDVRGTSGTTGGDIKLRADFTCDGSANNYTAQTTMIIQQSSTPTINKVVLNKQELDSLTYTITANKVSVPITVQIFDSTTGAMVSGVSDTFTPSSTVTQRTMSGLTSKLTAGRTYYLNAVIQGNTTPNRNVGFIHWSNAAPSGLTAVKATGPNFTDGKITNVTSEMEWRSASESTYKAITGTQITGLTAGDYYVRYKDTTGETNGWHLLSADTKVTVQDTTYAVTLGTPVNGSWVGSTSLTVKDTGSAEISFTPTNGYELLQANAAYTGTGTVTVDTANNKLTLSNVKSAGTVTITCTKTTETVDMEILQAEADKLKPTVTMDPLQALNTNLHSLIYNSGESRNSAVTYSFTNTTYTSLHLVTALNNTPTDQTVTTTVTLMKGTVYLTKQIALVFPKENVAPLISEIQTKTTGGTDAAVILNGLTFGAFYNEQVKVTVKGTDANSGLDKIYYQLVSASNPASAVPGSTWTELTADSTGSVSFTVPVVFKGAVFTKAVDKAGNSSISTYSKAGAFITESDRPTVTYGSPAGTAESGTYQTTAQNISVTVTDGTDTSKSSFLKEASVKVYKKISGSWELQSSKTQSSAFAFSDAKSSQTYTVPLNESGNYRLEAAGADHSGNTSVTTYGYLNLDVTKPVISYTSTAPADWVNSHVISVSLNEGNQDTSSGLAKLSLIKDGGTPAELKSYVAGSYGGTYSYTVETEGTHTYQFKLEDRAGNSTTTAAYVVKYDKTAPAYPVVTKAAPNGSQDPTTDGGITWYKGSKPSVTVTPAAAEADRSTNTSSYKLNDGAKTDVTSVQELKSSLKEGKNVLSVYAKDSAGNKALTDTAEEKTETFYVDAVNPQVDQIKATTLGASPISKILNVLTFGVFFQEKVKVEISAHDDTSGVKSIAYETYATATENDSHATTSWTTVDTTTGSIDFIIDPDFKGNIYAKAIDKAGNESAAAEQKKGSVIVEDDAPVITFEEGNLTKVSGSIYQKGSQDVKLVIADQGTNSWLKTTAAEVCKWDGTSYLKDNTLSKEASYSETDKKGTENSTIALAASGKYRITVKAKDQAGNGAADEVRYINVDVNAPTASYTSTAPADWVNSHTIQLDLDDGDETQESGLAKLYLSIDGGAETELESYAEGTFAETYSYTVETEGSHTYRFKLEDRAGNSTTTAAYVVKYDKTAPAYPVVTKAAPNGSQDPTTDGGITWYKGSKPSVIVTPAAAEADRSTNTSSYKLNDGAKTDVTSVQELKSSLKEGKNVLSVYAKDSAENKALTDTAEEKTETFYVDAANPQVDEIKATTLGASPISKVLNVLTFGVFFQEKVKIEISAHDDTSGVKSIAYETYATATENDSHVTTSWTTVDTTTGSIDFIIDPDFKGNIYAKAIDKAGNESAAAEQKKGSIIVEDDAPVITFEEGNLTKVSGSIYQKGSQDVKLVIADQGTNSWLKTTAAEVCKWDGTSYLKENTLSKEASYSGTDKKGTENSTIALAASGKYRITAKAKDQAGNGAADEVRYINVDVNAPTASYTSTAPADWVNSHTIQLDLDDGDETQESGLAKLYVSIDGGAETELESYTEGTFAETYSYTVETEGSHTYQFRMEDRAGNSTTTAAYAVKYDNSVLTYPGIDVPEANGDTDGDKTWYCQDIPEIVVDPVEQQTGRAERFTVVQVNDEPKIETSDPADIPLTDMLKQGENKITISAYDMAGNVSQGESGSEKQYILHIDTEQAELNSAEIAGQSIWNNAVEVYVNADSTITLKAEDSVSGMKQIAYVLYDGTDSGYAPQESDWQYRNVDDHNTITIPVSQEGPAKLFAKALDKAGNKNNLTVVQGTYIIDKTVPQITQIENSKTYYVKTAFGVTDENLDRVELDGSVMNSYMLDVNQNQNEQHSLKAYDKAGNVTEYVIYTKPLSSIMEPISHLTVNNVTNRDKDQIQAVRQQLEQLNTSDALPGEVQEIAEYIAVIDRLNERLKEIGNKLEEIKEAMPEKEVENVVVTEEEELKQLVDSIDELQSTGNLTEEEDAACAEKKDKLEKMLERIESVKILSEDKKELDKKGAEANKQELEAMEKRIEELLNIRVEVADSGVQEGIQIKYLMLALSPEEIWNYKGQNIIMEFRADYTEVQKTKAVAGYEAASAYDFNIFVKNGEDEKQLTSLPVPIQVTVGIASNLRGKEEYKMLRIHEGEEQLLDDIDDSDESITVATDQFSEYELLYPESKANKNTDKDNDKARGASTGDYSDAGMWMWILMGCLLLIMGMGIRRKKKS